MDKEVCEFTLQDIVPIAIIFVVTTIVLSYGGVVIGSVGSSLVSGQTVTATCNASSNIFTGCGTAYNITANGSSALNTFGTNLPLLATIVVAAIIITILVVYLGGQMMRK